jgi:hypothetical protein
MDSERSKKHNKFFHNEVQNEILSKSESEIEIERKNTN